jgi:uncharacterized membrane protein
MPSVGAFELVIVVLIALLIVVVPVIVIARAAAGRNAPAAPERDPAIEAIRSRYANGEIDEVEYQRLRSTLLRH